MTPKHRLVVVEWDDAWQDQENFASAHGISLTHHPMAVRTLGWLVQEDEAGVSIVNEKSEQDGSEVYRGRTFIPRAMVRVVTDFKLTVPRKAKAGKEVRDDRLGDVCGVSPRTG